MIGAGASIAGGRAQPAPRWRSAGWKQRKFATRSVAGRRQSELAGNDEEQECSPDRARGKGALATFEHDEVTPSSLGPKACSNHSETRTLAWSRRRVGVADEIYGVNNGLGAVFGIVSGVARATTTSCINPHGRTCRHACLVTLDGRGAYLADKSEREIYEAEIAREKAEVDENPEEESRRSRSFISCRICPGGIVTHGRAARAAARADRPGDGTKRAGSFPASFNQWTSAFSAALSTAVGAFIPIVPFFLMSGFPPVIAAFVISHRGALRGCAIKWLITIRPGGPRVWK